MKWIVVFLFFSITLNTEAQVYFSNGEMKYRQVFLDTDDFGDDYLENLEKGLEKLKNDSLRLKVLNDLGYFTHTRNLKKSMSIINRGLEEARKIGDVYWEGKLQVSQGAILLRLDELDWAEMVLKSAIEKIPENETWLLYTNLGYVFERRGNLGEAFEYASKTLKIGEKYGDEKAIAMAYSDMSNLFWKQGKPSIGVEYGLKSLALFEKRNLYDLDYDFTLHVVGNNLINLNRLEEALEYFQKSIAIGEKYGFYNNLSDTYIALSDLYNQKGDYIAAEKSGLEALKYAELLENDFMIMRSLLSLGKSNNSIGHFSHAIEFLEKSIQVATNDFGDKYYLSLVYLELSKAYEGDKKFAKALEASRTYDKLKQSVFTAEADQRISLLQTEMNVSQKENTINLQEARLEKQKILQIFILTLAGFLVVILGISYVVLVRRKKYNLLLEKQNLEKEHLLKEIHHRVKNNLETISSLLALQTAKIDNKEFQGIMEETQNRVHSIGMIHQRLYQGGNLKTIEMKDFFLNLGEYIIDTFNASQRVSLICTMEPLELEIDQAIPIGLIVNELLSNSLKYAFPNGNKGSIKVSLSERESHLYLQVSDNGVGIGTNPEVHGSGFGTQLIQLLTRQLDGKMSLVTNSGTEVFFEFQIHKAA
ncbi:tetratricopeptide repeat-containing sensor histidine kinase [Aquiflexum gelatinilyticum]|uniref:tetratricopeptide repeat-containing sensor histidine kinase n=1 Tax=Aquiflexum gelatinilyticum TaxID=2961943 RepID=UPI002169C624|nr:histidine kinase dimerization/phosphoacceptor domain -containing protein [Aquiflexum gelatinilyticum]MCS4435164.1 tetratricopeptide repeat protein [Aquiflexum gelatinilyticum]